MPTGRVNLDDRRQSPSGEGRGVSAGAGADGAGGAAGDVRARGFDPQKPALAEAAYQRCYVQFLRKALDYVPRRVDDDCLQELRSLHDRRDLSEARRDLAAWLTE